MLGSFISQKRDLTLSAQLYLITAHAFVLHFHFLPEGQTL